MPVVAVLHGAVIGGGLELAAAAHVRVAERSAFYALPEGQRGIFVGGGGAMRLPRLIGLARMTDMMLTGRAYGAEEAQHIGLTHYLVDVGEGLARGTELARRIAANAPLTNFAVMHVLPRIAELDPAAGLLNGSRRLPSRRTTKRQRRVSRRFWRNARPRLRRRSDMDPKGHAAVVTGAASGLGAQTAVQLADAGAKVALLDLNVDAARDVAARIGGIAVRCDVADADSAAAASPRRREGARAGRILVNCAGIGPAKRIIGRDGAMPLADFERVIAINLIGTFNMMRLVAAEM